MIQRIQSLWMALTAAFMCLVFFMPVVYFSMGGAEFRLMAYGIKGMTGQMLVMGGEALESTLITSTLSICVAILIGVSALVPLVTLFLYKNRMLQVRLISAEFILLIGSIGLLAYYIYVTYRDVVSVMSSNFYFSFWPLLLVLAILTNWFALRGVMRDELLVRSVDRIR